MTYTDQQGTAHDLPKYDMRLMRMQSAVDASKAREARLRNMWAFLELALGHDALAALADGQTFDSADLVAVEVAYTGVVSAYEAPARDASRAAMSAKMGELDGVDVSKLERLAGALRDMYAAVPPELVGK